MAIVGRLRRFVITWTVRMWHSAMTVVRELRSPRRVGSLIGANVASEVILAFTLQTFARALGYHVGFAEVLLITVSVRVLAGIVPIPGGIGVAEGGLVFGLVRAGLPEEVAFAVVVLYRLATFYLPPVWGFFALRWLERNKHCEASCGDVDDCHHHDVQGGDDEYPGDGNARLRPDAGRAAASRPAAHVGLSRAR